MDASWRVVDHWFSHRGSDAQEKMWRHEYTGFLLTGTRDALIKVMDPAVLLCDVGDAEPSDVRMVIKPLWVLDRAWRSTSDDVCHLPELSLRPSVSEASEPEAGLQDLSHWSSPVSTRSATIASNSAWSRAISASVAARSA